MSHSYGAVKFSDGTIKHFEYSGTVDVCIPQLRDSLEEVQNHWRSGEWKHHSKECNEDEDVIICSTYGGGFSWKGRACKKCNLITDNFEPDYDSESDGIPDWYPNKQEYEDYFKS